MKLGTHILVIFFALAASAYWCPAQSLETVYEFNGTNGAAPQFGGLTLGSDGNFYGITGSGGITNSMFPKGMGTVFTMTTNKTVTTLVLFSFTNGASPSAPLAVGNDGKLYGTTFQGGLTNSANPKGLGTVFTITTNGVFSILVFFDSTNGVKPSALAVANDGTFYGQANGKLFCMTTNGTLTIFTNVTGLFFNHVLTWGPDGCFYGTTYTGGNKNFGSIFKISTNGSLTTLVSFNTTNGAGPEDALTLGSDGNFYGTTAFGGSNSIYSCGSCGYGTIFQMTTNGTLTQLVSFNSTTGSGTNVDGNQPFAALTLGRDGNFYGTTAGGGNNGSGTIFRVTTNGVLVTLASFTNGYNIDPNRMVLGIDGDLYGTTVGGGITNSIFSLGIGTIFVYHCPKPPTLSLHFSNDFPELILIGTLSNNFIVQSSENLTDPNWTNLVSLTNLTVIPYSFLDSNWINHKTRYYRAIMQ